MKKIRKLSLGKITVASINYSHKIIGGTANFDTVETCTCTINNLTCGNTCGNTCADTCGNYSRDLSDCQTTTVDTTTNNHTLGCPPPLG